MNPVSSFSSIVRPFAQTVVLLALPWAVQAQSVSVYRGAVTGNTGGSTYALLQAVLTAAPAAPATPLSGGTRDEGYFNNLPIGFGFNFANTVYTTFSASTNGWLTFGQALTDAGQNNDLTANFNPATNRPVRPIVAPFWDDLSLGTAGSAATDGNFYYKTTGVAGSRICTIEWRNMRWDATATSPVLSFLVRLKEGSNSIDFTYGQPSSGGSGSGNNRGASVGLAGVPVVDFLSASSLGSNVTFSTSMETVDINSRPSNGRQLSFTPMGLAAHLAEALATFQLAPNPAAGQVQVLGNAKRLPVHLFDHLGRLVLTQTAAADVLNLQGIAPGLYVVRVGQNCRRLAVE